MDITQAIIYLGGLITFVTEIVKRIPVSITDKNPKITAVVVAVLLIGTYGYVNGDSIETVAQQVVIGTPLSYVIYDIVKAVYSRVKTLVKK